MSEINTEGKGGGKKGKAKKLSTRVDFTPMVDLGFLLITFFMLTTSMIKPQTMEIAMPSKDVVKDPTTVKNSLAITIILGKNNKVFYYNGTEIKGVAPKIEVSDYSPNGIRKMLLDRNKNVMMEVKKLKLQKENKEISEDTLKVRVTREKSVKDAPIILIKATDDSSYKNLVDVLDEMMICNIGKYAIVDITPKDLEWIKDVNN